MEQNQLNFKVKMIRKVGHDSSFGPVYGFVDLGIKSDFIKDGDLSGFPNAYQDNLGKRKTIFTILS